MPSSLRCRPRGWFRFRRTCRCAIATGLMLQGLTAHYLSHSAYSLGPGKSCLVHAGAGGVGQLLIQLAKLRGATVIATVGSEEKAAIARERGADHVILYRDVDFRDEVMRLTDGRGVDVVYDAVGRDTIARSIRSLARRGLCINYGGASGLVASIEPLELGRSRIGILYAPAPRRLYFVGSRAARARGGSLCCVRSRDAHGDDRARAAARRRRRGASLARGAPDEGKAAAGHLRRAAFANRGVATSETHTRRRRE